MIYIHEDEIIISNQVYCQVEHGLIIKLNARTYFLIDF